MGQRYKEVPTYQEMPHKLCESIAPPIQKLAKAIYYTAARAGELVQIKAKHVWEEDDFVKVNLMTEKNKHQTSRIIPICKSVEPEGAALYLSLAENKDPNEYLFPKSPGIQMDSYLRVMRRDFNEEYNVAPHFFRHCRLTHMVTRFDYNSHELVQYAGWTDERPAKYYVHLRTEDLERKMSVKRNE